MRSTTRPAARSPCSSTLATRLATPSTTNRVWSRSSSPSPLATCSPPRSISRVTPEPGSTPNSLPVLLCTITSTPPPALGAGGQHGALAGVHAAAEDRAGGDRADEDRPVAVDRDAFGLEPLGSGICWGSRRSPPPASKEGSARGALRRRLVGAVTWGWQAPHG